jgi:hypothetical protein
MSSTIQGAIAIDTVTGESLARFHDDTIAGAMESGIRWFATDPGVEVHPLTFDDLSALAFRFGKCVACQAPAEQRGRVVMFVHESWCSSLSDLPQTTSVTWPRLRHLAERVMDQVVGR